LHPAEQDSDSERIYSSDHRIGQQVGGQTRLYLIVIKNCHAAQLAASDLSAYRHKNQLESTLPTETLTISERQFETQEMEVNGARSNTLGA
jgi:hypothetical protein